MAQSNDSVEIKGAGEPRGTRVRRSGAHSRVTAQRITDPRARVLAAFPWAAWLSSEEQLRFANELSGHPRDLPNSGLEELIVRWKMHALEERSRRAA